MLSDPKKTDVFFYEDLSKKQALACAVEVARKLQWKLSFITENSITGLTKPSMLLQGEKIVITLLHEKGNISSECIGNQLTDWGKNNKNIQHFLQAFAVYKSAVNKQSLQEIYANEQQSFGQLNDISLADGNAGRGFLLRFIPRENYFISPIIININIFIFILMLLFGVNVFAPDTETLLNWGANYRPVTIEGQWWRLITSCFIHKGILHLVMNMYALVYIGLLLEPQIGKTRILTAYLLTGIAASSTSLRWHDNVISAGASGAIFGLYGIFIALLTTNIIDKKIHGSLLASIGIFVAYNLLNGLTGNADNAAHMGGLASGIITGYLFVPALKKPWSDDLKLITTGAAAALITGVSVYLYNHSTNDIPKYETKMKKFDTMQSLALEIYSLPEGTPKEKLLSEIRDKGLYYWDEMEALLKDADKLEIPEAYHQRNKKLLEYCKLRSKSYNMLYLFVQTNDQKFKDSTKYYNAQIESITKELIPGR
jgi:rhomboid protease GluP